mmetsp:Transcript_5268/g.18701  ORF Transcript_5268/g.18701 Transcript_5268/m.18701 type:complete len:210 (-) Transcript_5268:72-701(-)
MPVQHAEQPRVEAARRRGGGAGAGFGFAGEAVVLDGDFFGHVERGHVHARHSERARRLRGGLRERAEFRRVGGDEERGELVVCGQVALFGEAASQLGRVATDAAPDAVVARMRCVQQLREVLPLQIDAVDGSLALRGPHARRLERWRHDAKVQRGGEARRRVVGGRVVEERRRFGVVFQVSPEHVPQLVMIAEPRRLSCDQRALLEARP